MKIKNTIIILGIIILLAISIALLSTNFPQEKQEFTREEAINYDLKVIQDNLERDYDTKERKVTVLNKQNKEKLLDIQLKTPHHVKAPVGYSKVAEIKINPNIPYEKIIENIELYNVKDNYSKFDRDIDYKYKVKKNVSIVKEVCSNITGECSEQHIFDTKKTTWKDFNNSIKSNKEIVIGLFTNVKKNDFVEWIPQISGIRVPEWALWTGSDAPEAYYALDGNSGNVVDETGKGNTGTNNGATRGVTGKISNAFDFESTETDSVNIANGVNVTSPDDKSFTINAWIKRDNVDQTGVITRQDSAGNYDYFFLVQDNTNNNRLDLAFNPGNGTQQASGSTALNNDGWVMVTGTFDSSTNNLSVYVNGSLDGTISTSSTPLGSGLSNTALGTRPDLTNNPYDGVMDEVGFWNRTLTKEELTDLYNNGDGIAFGNEVDVNLTIDLQTPPDNKIFTTRNINFSVNISATSGGIGVENVTIEVFNSTGLAYSETNTSGVFANYSFSNNFNFDGDYDWNITSYSNDSSRFTSETRSFSIDTIDPSLDVTFPNETIDFHKKNTNLSLNWTVSDANLNTCWFNWNGTNKTVTCTDNQQFFNITDGTNKNLTFWTNDTAGNTVNDFVIWDYRLFFNKQKFDLSIFEGSQTDFSANFLTNDSNINTAILNHNSTENTGSISNHGSNNFTVKETITLTKVNQNENITFFWNITQDTFSQTIPERNQTIEDIKIDDCSIQPHVLYNFSMKDEEELTILEGNTTAKVNLQINAFGTDTLIEGFNQSYSSNPFSICLNNNFSEGGNLQHYVQIQYDQTNYVKELHHIQNETLNNSDFPTNVDLLDLNNESSETFRIIFRDSSFLPVEDALIKISRKYIDENKFRITEIPKTDARGETLAHLTVDEAIYNIDVVKWGKTLAEFRDVIAICQIPLVQECEIDLNAFSESLKLPDFESTEDFNFTLGYDNKTRIVSSTFEIPSGNVEKVTLNVTQEDALGTSICTDNLLTSSGTLSCTVPDSFGNSTISAKIFRSGDLQAQGQVKTDQNPRDIYGVNVVILGMFVMISLIGAGLSNNPISTTLFLMLGVILLFSLNLVSNSGFIGATATVLWFIIAIIIVLIKGARRN